jgi:hypothetical protein
MYDYIIVEDILELNPHFLATETVVEAGEEVWFTNETTGGDPPYTRAQWDFGDNGIIDVDYTIPNVMNNAVWDTTGWGPGVYHVRLWMTDNASTTRNEVRNHYITINAGSCTLTTEVIPSAGSISPSGGTYACGTTLNLTAIPSPCSYFDHWGGDASGTQNPITITMDSDKHVIAYFLPAPMNALTTEVNPPGSGTVTPSSGWYCSGTPVTLTATPSLGWLFEHWAGDASGTQNPITITMDYDKNVVAYFAQAPAISYIPRNGLRFRAKEDRGSIEYGTLIIRNSGPLGCAPLNWTVSDDADWLSLDPLCGIIPRGQTISLFLLIRPV